MSRIGKLLENKQDFIWYAGKKCIFNSTFDNNDEAQAMIDYYKNRGLAAACTHEGDSCHLYVEDKTVKNEGKSKWDNNYSEVELISFLDEVSQQVYKLAAYAKDNRMDDPTKLKTLIKLILELESSIK